MKRVGVQWGGGSIPFFKNQRIVLILNSSIWGQTKLYKNLKEDEIHWNKTSKYKQMQRWAKNLAFMRMFED